MLVMGDEYGHTKHGNNNTWCQDNPLSWLQWDRLKENRDFWDFTRKLIAFRRNHPSLRRTTFLKKDEICWHGLEPFAQEWEHHRNYIAFTLNQGLYAAFNAYELGADVTFPDPPEGKRWQWVVNTANPPPHDFMEDFPPVKSHKFHMVGRSALLLFLR